MAALSMLGFSSQLKEKHVQHLICNFPTGSFIKETLSMSANEAFQSAGDQQLRLVIEELNTHVHAQTRTHTHIHTAE